MVSPRVFDSRVWSPLPEMNVSERTPIKPVLDGDGKIFVQIASYRGKFDVSWSGIKCLTVLILTGVLFLLAFAFYRRWRALWRDFEILV